MKSILKFLSIFAFAFLTACGGGGGGSTPTPTATFTITATAGPHGTITPPGQTVVEKGGSQGYAIVADSGYKIASLVIDGVSIAISNTHTFTNVQADQQIDVTFALTATHSISGTVKARGVGVAGVTITRTPIGPGDNTTVTNADGTWVIADVPVGTYAITPSASGNTIFTPTSTTVPVSDANVSGIDFTAPIEGKILSPCKASSLFTWDFLCSQDIVTGAVVYTIGIPPNDSPRLLSTSPQAWWTLVTNRTNDFVAFNSGGIATRSLTSVGITQAVIANWPLLSGCSSTPQGSFDLTQTGDVVVFSDICNGAVNANDIVLMMMDGSMFYSKVTNDTSFDWSPAIGSAGGANDPLDAYFASNRAGCGSGVCIWKQVSTPSTNTLGSLTLVADTGFVSDPLDPTNPFSPSTTHPYLQLNEKVISIDAGYTKMAYTKVVNNTKHIVVHTMADGTEIDLGAGSNPRFALDGNNVILYDCDLGQCVINPDGTGKLQLPALSNLSGSAGQAVFGPAGY